MHPLHPGEASSKSEVLLQVELSENAFEAEDWHGIELSFWAMLGIQLSYSKLPAEQA